MNPTRRPSQPRLSLVPALVLMPSLLLTQDCAAALPQAMQDLLNSVTNQTAAKPAAAATSPTSPAAPASAALMLGRDAAGLNALFDKTTVTGVDLLAELKGVQRIMGGSKPGQARESLLGLADPQQAGAAGGGLFGGLFGGGGNPITNLGIKAGLAALESALPSSPLGALGTELRGHLDLLIGDTQTLQAETVTMPSRRGLSPQQMQRAATMGAVIVVTRISSRMLKQAQQDLAGLDQEYATLIERREKAAVLLQQALAGGLPPQAESRFSAKDLGELRTLAETLGVAGFAKDMGAQTKAMQLLAVTDPAGFADYRAQTEGLTKRQTAALRTVGGFVAVGILASVVGREVVKIGKDQPVAELMVFGPLMLAFVTEVPSIVQSMVGILSEGSSSLLRSTRSFRVTAAGKTEEVSDASAVFDMLAQNGAAAEFQQALFRDSARGLVYQVNQCDPDTAAQMLDAAVPTSQRASFAQAMRLPEPDNFSFRAAWAPGSGAPAGLADELLGKDHRPRLADRQLPIAEVQRAVAGGAAEGGDGAKPGYRQWNTEQLLRLVFTNRDGSAAQFAAMEVAGVVVRPVPSMSSLYAYEKLADACRTQFSPSTVAVAAAPAAEPAAAPAKPAAKAKTEPKASTTAPTKKR